MLWLQCFQLAHGNLVIAIHFHISTELPQVLDNVIGEGIVVIDHYEHKSLPSGRLQPYRRTRSREPLQSCLGRFAPEEPLTKSGAGRLWGKFVRFKSRITHDSLAVAETRNTEPGNLAPQDAAS